MHAWGMHAGDRQVRLPRVLSRWNDQGLEQIISDCLSAGVPSLQKRLAGTEKAS